MTWKNTPEQQRVVDEIRRTARAMDGRSNAVHRPRTMSNREYRDIGSRAARWVHDTPGALFSDAAERFGLAMTTVHANFKRLYPTASTKGRWK